MPSENCAVTFRYLPRENRGFDAPSALAPAIAAFILRCQSGNLARGTISWYRQILGAFEAHLAHNGSVGPGEINSTHIRGYLGARQAAGISSETVFREWGALKCFFRFLSREGVIPTNPMATVERPRRERHLIQPLTPLQVKALLEQPALESQNGLRDRAMMLLMVDSGLRLSEVLTLESNRIYWEDRQLVVLGKGRKERVVPLGRHSLAALEAYQRVRGAGGRLFFLGRGGGVNSRTIQVAMKEYGKSAGIQGVRMSPHTLRHTFAIQWIRNEGDIFSLQAILGHSSLDMVRNYVNLAQRDITVKHRKFSPVDRLLGDEVPRAVEPKGVVGLHQASGRPRVVTAPTERGLEG